MTWAKKSGNVSAAPSSADFPALGMGQKLSAVRDRTLSQERQSQYPPQQGKWSSKPALVYKRKDRRPPVTMVTRPRPIESVPSCIDIDLTPLSNSSESSSPDSSLDAGAPAFQPGAPTKSKVTARSAKFRKQRESARELLNKKNEKALPKAVVVAQFKEQTIEYKAKVDQLNSELHKTRGEARHYKELADKLKNDLGMLLKRSFTMLREAREKASDYKQQLDELREAKPIFLTPPRENGRLSMSSARSGSASGASQGSDLEILSMTSNNSNGRSNGFEQRIPSLSPPITFGDMPMAPWWAMSPPNGSHPLFDESDEILEKFDGAQEDARERPRRTIGPASPSFFDGQRSSSKDF